MPANDTPLLTVSLQIQPFNDAPQVFNGTESSVTLRNIQLQGFAYTVDPSIQNRVTVSQPPVPPNPNSPGRISISGASTGGSRVPMLINVVNVGSISQTDYFECGLTFNLVTTSQGNPSRVGRDNFPPFIVTNSGLYVIDAMQFGADYEFLVMFQNANGAIAVIDPRITNTA